MAYKYRQVHREIERKLKRGAPKLPMKNMKYSQKEVKRLSFQELYDKAVYKMKYLKEQGFDKDIDPAVPQTWLDDFTEWCKKNRPEITYHLIASTTCWDHTVEPVMGRPLTICTEVQEALEAWNNE